MREVGNSVVLFKGMLVRVDPRGRWRSNVIEESRLLKVSITVGLPELLQDVVLVARIVFCCIDELLKVPLSHPLYHLRNSLAKLLCQRWEQRGLGYLGLAKDILVRGFLPLVGVS